MKIVIISHRFYPDIGGIESVSDMLGNYFWEKGNEIKVLTWTKASGSKAYPFEILRAPSFLKLIAAFLWADVVFENNPALRLSWPSIFLQKAKVVALHTWITRLDGTKAWVDKLKLSYLNSASTVVACSKTLRDKTYPDAEVVENPYDSTVFQLYQNIIRDKDFVFLGRLVSDKGVAIAIEAFSEFLKHSCKTKDSTLTIIGDGEDRGKLETLTKELGIVNQVTFKGSMKGAQLAMCLNEHRYMLIPSVWKEPFGIVALEGMACGCLPIVADGGGLPEAVGSAGLIFKRGDSQDLLRCMLKAVSDDGLNEKLAEQARPQLEKHLLKNAGARYYNVLQAALMKKKI